MANIVDVPDQEWQRTQYQHLKFSRAKSSRATYIINIEETFENSNPPNRSYFDREKDSLTFAFEKMKYQIN